MLTDSQQTAYEELKPFLTGEANLGTAVITGVAGTGKSFLTGKIVIDLVSEGYEVAVAAPTNKAVKVIKEKVEQQAGRPIGASFSSIHSLLGLKLIEHEDGNQSCQPLGEPRIGSYDVVVVDECSMIGEQLFGLIKRSKEGARILFVGDPAQLPPVADREDISPTFTAAELKVRLTEIVRQAKGSDIILLSTHIRDSPVRVKTRHLQQLLRNLDVVMAPGNMLTVAETAKQAIERGEDARIIAYMNSSVVYYNKKLHAHFYGNDTPFCAGERAIVQQQCEMTNILGVEETLITNEEVIVKSVEREEHPRFSDIDSWLLTVSTDLGGTYKAFVAHDQSALDKKVEELFSKWRALKSKGLFEEAKTASSMAWSLRKAFAPLRHSYAMTAHKTQGSTFDTAIVDMENMSRIKSTFTYNKGLYVAVTRPRKFLYIIHD